MLPKRIGLRGMVVALTLSIVLPLGVLSVISDIEMPGEDGWHLAEPLEPSELLSVMVTAGAEKKELGDPKIAELRN